MTALLEYFMQYVCSIRVIEESSIYEWVGFDYLNIWLFEHIQGSTSLDNWGTTVYAYHCIYVYIDLSSQ